ncbi:MarR family winged helix-turn-helix transcriptional regulator [Paenibacillus sp. FJAT-26967]|uniref:MarR family winged helix-turn-helix transcriptional regulator n=1 Tax=Paenibacillus sp. FJAT-26967 TaxID=1729690 RepID=UPI000A03DEBF|nr:MarR family winged helix-turn-helix transcriptional regulator [Paenibacillus sp. FJAT-26967]
MEDKDWALLEEADWLFRRMVRKFVKERDKISVGGITLPGMLILNSIQREGEQRLGELAEQLDFTSGAVTALCDKLEAGGYAVRKRSATDRRAIALEITDRGRELIGRSSGISACMIEVLFSGYTQEELKHQIALSRRLLERLDGFAEAVLRQTGDDIQDAIPGGTPDENPGESSDGTLDGTPDESQDDVPDETPGGTSDEAPDESLDDMPDETPGGTPDETSDERTGTRQAVFDPRQDAVADRTDAAPKAANRKKHFISY